MTVAIPRLLPRLTGKTVALPALSLVAALLLARYMASTVIPHVTSSLYGPYLLAPLGWLAAGGVGLYVYRQLPQPAETETTVSHRTVLMVAALIGVFLVSTQFLVGMLGGFGHSPYAHTPRWLATNLLFAGSVVLATEFSRAALLRAIGPRSLTLALVVTTLGLAAVQFTDAQLTQSGFSREAQFWGATFIPLAATGLLAGFFVLYGGIPAGLLVSAPLVIFQYYSPILPAAEWPILALAGVAGPAMGLWIAEGLFTADEAPEENTGWLKLPSVSWVLTAVIALAIFWFSFGFFGFRPAFVPSHSMEPLINQGDVVLVGPVHADTVKVGDIILYELPNKQRVLHRVIAIDTSAAGAREFTFKGDNNNTPDLEPVTGKQLIGAYINRVPKIGWVAIKFNELIGAVR